MKIVVNGKVKHESVKSSDGFSVPVTVHGNKILVQAVQGTDYDLQFQGKLFHDIWNEQKKQSEFKFKNSTNREEAKDDLGDIKMSASEKEEQIKQMKEFERMKKEKKRADKEKKQNEAALQSGFDHGFSNLASYND